MVGGLTAKTPWVEKAAITKPYLAEETPEGKQDHVMAAPLGENAFLVELERFLLTTDAAGQR